MKRGGVSHWAMLTAGLLGLGALLASSPALAVYQCGDQKDTCKCGGVPNPFPCCSNGGNCTWWAWEAACCHWHVDVPMRHDAKTWAEDAKKSPDYKVLPYPVVNSIAVYDEGTWGHVAWVIAVNGDKITVTEEKCGGDYGMHQATYYASQFTGGFIVRADQQCECSAGQTDSKSCERCGHQTRTCSDGCNWDPWSDCQGQGTCDVGDKNVEACGTCGSHEQWCGLNCQWQPWGDCQGPDPAGGTQSCTTGLPGICAQGTNRCVNGNVQCVSNTPASVEVCNGLDDDCDGATDEDDICAGGQPQPPEQDSSVGTAGAGGDTPPESDAGVSGRPSSSSGSSFTKPENADGCACRVENAGSPDERGSWLAIAALAALGLSRRNRGRARRS